MKGLIEVNLNVVRHERVSFRLTWTRMGSLNLYGKEHMQRAYVRYFPPSIHSLAERADLQRISLSAIFIIIFSATLAQ